MKAAAGLLGIFVTMPIWFYLLYKVLQGVSATDLMWFLYWVYVPFTIIVQIALKLAEE